MNLNSAEEYKAWTKLIQAAVLALTGWTDSSTATYSVRSTLSGSAGRVKPGLSIGLLATVDATAGVVDTTG
jgi:hypothetical protein